MKLTTEEQTTLARLRRQALERPAVNARAASGTATLLHDGWAVKVTANL